MSKNCIFISLLLIVVFHFENSIAGDGYWTKIGPDDRTYKAMAIDSQNPNVFYTGSFYKSRDGGKTWQNLGDHFLGGSKFLVVHPKDSTLIYGGCVFQKIKRSNDGGKTFKSVSSGLPDNTFYDLIPGKLAVHPELTNVVFIAGENNIFKSENQGDLWIKLQGTGLPTKATLDIVAVNPKEPNIIYASSYGGFPGDPIGKSEYGVYKTEDGGDNWQKIWGGANNIYTFVIDPVNPDTLYIGGIPGVWRSMDGGDSWVAVNNGVQTPNDNSDILVHPIYNNIIYCSQGFGYYSLNAAKNWSPIPKDSLEYLPSVIIGLLAIHPIDNTIYAGGPSVKGIWSLTMNQFVPVELEAFSGHWNGHSVFLKWQTTSETNNYGFEIERRSYSEHFKKLAFVKGNGTNNTSTQFEYFDEIKVSGKYYYRLKQIDLNGEIYYSEEIIVDVNTPRNFKLYQNYPNPFNPETTISYELPQSAFVSIEIYDVTGRLIEKLLNEKQTAGKHALKFSADRLSSGVYFYRLTADKNVLATKKMIVLK